MNHADNKENHFQCLICLKTLSSRKNLKRHTLEIHSNTHPFKCDICEKTFSRAENLKEHEILHTGEKPFQCKICLKQYLKKHEVVHSDIRPFKCNVCEKAFHRAKNLKLHEMIHTGERPYQCKFCSMKFTQQCALKNHEMAIHSNIRPFKCDLCDKTWARKHCLTDHIKMVHSINGNKSHKCRHCGMEFYRRSKLVSHERIHTGEKQFFCRFCDKSFIHRGSYRAHEEIHMNKDSKPYKCGICSRGFSLEVYLNGHLKTHNDAERTLSCHLCPMRFIWRTEQRKHVDSCKNRARAALVEDGMSEEEALLAVEPPFKEVHETIDEEIDDCDSGEDNNPLNLKKCYVKLKRKAYFEKALSRGCTTFLIQKRSCGSSNTLKPIW